MNKCEDCEYLEVLGQIKGYCLFPYQAAIPHHIHTEGFIWDIDIAHSCEAYEKKQ